MRDLRIFVFAITIFLQVAQGDSRPTGHHRGVDTLPVWPHDFEAPAGSVVGQDPTSVETYSHKDPEKVADNTNLPLPDEAYLPGDSPPTGHHREEHTLPLWSQDFEAISGSIVGQDPTSSGLYSHNGPVRPGGNNLPVANERYLPGTKNNPIWEGNREFSYESSSAPGDYASYSPQTAPESVQWNIMEEPEINQGATLRKIIGVPQNSNLPMVESSQVENTDMKNRPVEELLDNKGLPKERQAKEHLGFLKKNNSKLTEIHVMDNANAKSGEKRSVGVKRELMEDKSWDDKIENEDGASGHDILKELLPDDSFSGESGYEDYEIETIVKMKGGGPPSGDPWEKDAKLVSRRGKMRQHSEEWSKSHGEREFAGEGEQEQFGNGTLASGEEEIRDSLKSKEAPNGNTLGIPHYTEGEVEDNMAKDNSSRQKRFAPQYAIIGSTFGTDNRMNFMESLDGILPTTPSDLEDVAQIEFEDRLTGSTATLEELSVKGTPLFMDEQRQELTGAANDNDELRRIPQTARPELKVLTHTSLDEPSTETFSGENKNGAGMKPSFDDQAGKGASLLLEGKGKTFTKSEIFGEGARSISDHEEIEKDNKDGEEKGGSSSRKKRGTSDNEEGSRGYFHGDINIKKEDGFPMPPSEVRWNLFAMAHAFGQENSAYHSREGSTVSEAASRLILAFLFGGFILVLLLGFFILFAIWPIRKYFAYFTQSYRGKDLESGQYYGDELTSIRVDRNGQFDGPVVYQDLAPATAVYQQPPSGPGYIQMISSSGRKKKLAIPHDKIIGDDRKRDRRNAERRKIIKRQTSDRRNSLIQSILVAKSVIDGYAENKIFEDIASERRQKIKMDSSHEATRSSRRKSFSEEVQSACSVIKPDWDDEEKMERAKEKRLIVKRRISGKRRTSLLDEILVAREVIVDGEKMVIAEKENNDVDGQQEYKGMWMWVDGYPTSDQLKLLATTSSWTAADTVQ